jgi:predicted nucleic acid-binding protein
MARLVVDSTVVLHLLATGQEDAVHAELVAPTLIRSQVLAELYRAVRKGELAEDVGREHLTRFARMKVRYLGDAVLRRRAWKVAEDLGWDAIEDAEYVALAQLQADAFVTLNADLAAAVEGVVDTVGVAALFDQEEG